MNLQIPESDKKPIDDLVKLYALNLSWQVGHQIISIYYHIIMTTVGHVSELIENLNLRLYTEICNYNTFAKDMGGKTDPNQLLEHLKLMQAQSLEVINSLSENDLRQAVEPTKFRIQ